MTGSVKNRYILQEEIGKGGMGVVCRAWDSDLEREVAIKLLKPELFRNASAQRRFHRETRLQARLRHPSIVAIYDTVSLPEGQGIVMELVTGRTLRRIFGDQPRSVDRVLPMLRQIAAGLAYIHKEKILHLDLKLDNVMLDDGGRVTNEEGQIKILDFGLAMYLEPPHSSGTGHRGTPEYMAPEIYAGKRPDKRSDLFSFGVLAYSLLTGCSPFSADGYEEILKRVQTEQPLSVIELNAEIPRELSNLVDRLLQKWPGDRPSDAARVEEDLRRIEKSRRTLPPPDIVDRAVFASSLEHYLERLPGNHRKIPVPGLQCRLREAQRSFFIDEIYISLRARRPHCGSTSGTEALSSTEKFPIEEALRLTTEVGGRGLVFLGKPGSGKTTLLKHLLLATTRGHSEKLGLPKDAVPVYIGLRDLADPGAGLEAALASAVQYPNMELDAEAFGRDLRHWRPLFLLVDGLDEVSNPTQRSAVARWLEETLEQFENSHIVVTSRYTGYREEARLNQRFSELHLCELTASDIRRFAEIWHEVVLREKNGLPPQSSREQARKAAAQLSELLLASEDQRLASLRELACNPLMLHCLCLMNREHQSLPARRGKLYQECLIGLLDLWASNYGLDADLRSNEALRILQPLAFHLQSAGNQPFHISDALGLLSRPLHFLGYDPEEGEHLLGSICDQTGVLESTPDGHLSFSYQSFQEYLAARHIQDQFLRAPALLDQVCEHFGEVRWRELILLLLGLENPSLFDRLMKRFLDRGALHRDSDLAAHCLQDASEPHHEPFLEALGRSHHLGNPATLGTAERKLTLHLLSRLEGWREATLQDGRKGHEVVAQLTRHDPDDEIRRQAHRLLGDDSIHIHPIDGSELVKVPGGEFVLGSDYQDGARPAHRVFLHPYSITKFPVTNRQYARYLRATGAREPALWHDPRFNHWDQPVVGISWDEAREYCRWAGLELPTEAQWEAAARSPDQRDYPWGTEEPSKELAHFLGSGDRPSPVGRLVPGPFDAFDQAGNVWEWCLDIWNPRAYYRRNGAVDPVAKTGEAVSRVVRGGAWNYDAWVLLSTFRFSFAFESRRNDIGFRCVLNSHQDQATESLDHV